MLIVFGTGTAQTVSMMNPYDWSGDALACVFMQRCMLPYQHDSFAGCLRKKNSQQFCDPAPAVQTVACLANKNAI